MADSAQAIPAHQSLAIGGAEIGRCLARIHHDRFTVAEPVDDPIRERFRTRGLEFEDTVLDIVADAVPSLVDLRRLDFGERTRATTQAMAAGANAIFGGRLVGEEGDSVGMPDILIHDGTGYLPIDVKHHKVIGETGEPVIPSPLVSLLSWDADPVPFRTFRRADLLQVAHYAALLEEQGWRSARPMGGVIGSDEPLTCVWADLSAGDPSPLDARGDFLDEARAVVAHGVSHPADPLVSPWHQSACRTCPWVDVCIPELERIGDPTLLRGINRKVRSELHEIGVDTIDDVAALSLDDGPVPPETVFQARAMSAGGLLRAHDGGPLDLPVAALEVDLDIETIGPLTYLAGLAITSDGSTIYEPIVAWSGDDDGERAVLEALFGRLHELGEAGAVVYHWTDFEVVRLAAGAERHGLAMPDGTSIESWFDEHAVDLCAWSREHLVSPSGHSLKTIAPLCGFTWRDSDPGGLQSELWFEAQLVGDTASRMRIVRYNEDDVLAQAAIRAFVRGSNGPNPAHHIPSATVWPPRSA